MRKDWREEMDDARAALIQKDDQCEHCGGTGNEFLFMYQECPDCNGTGVKQKKGETDENSKN